MTTNVLTSEQIDEALDAALSELLVSLDSIGARYGVSGEALAWHLKKRGIARRPRASRADRFWVKVDKRGPDECWEWTGARNERGYGWFRTDRGAEAASRVAYRLTFGSIPHGLHVCHRCDNPPCVNPAHLWLGTNADNTRDRDEKGRHVSLRGEAATGARLTAAQVEAIRDTYARGGVTQYQLADAYGVSQSTVGLIVRGQSWRDVAAKAYGFDNGWGGIEQCQAESR